MEEAGGLSPGGDDRLASGQRPGSCRECGMPDSFERFAIRQPAAGQREHEIPAALRGFDSASGKPRRTIAPRNWRCTHSAAGTAPKPTGAGNVRFATRLGSCSATAVATAPPSECPTNAKRVRPSETGASMMSPGIARDARLGIARDARLGIARDARFGRHRRASEPRQMDRDAGPARGGSDPPPPERAVQRPVQQDERGAPAGPDPSADHAPVRKPSLSLDSSPTATGRACAWC